MRALIKRFMLVGVLLGLNALASMSYADSKPKKQRKGWDLAGFPLVNFTTDRGVGYGAYLATFYHGKGQKNGEPYRASIGGQFYQTTGGYQFHKLLLDFPNMLGTGLRFDLVSGYEAWDSAKYFGIGNSTPRLLPEQTPDQFYDYGVKNLWVVPTLRIPVGKPWSIFARASVRVASVDIYGGSRLDHDRPTGFEGGVYPQMGFGLMADTRNKEPSTSNGYFFEVSVRSAQRWWGSDWGSWGTNITHRQWFELITNDVLVFALRVGFDAQNGDVPFFHQSVLGGSQWVELGGNLVLRGLTFGRYRGSLIAYSNWEMRWDVVDFELWKKDFKLLIVPYIDLARVWTGRERDSLLHIHATGGVGPRLVYNDVFVVRLDVGWGLEEYTNAAAPFGRDVKQTKPVLGVYLVVGHPF